MKGIEEVRPENRVSIAIGVTRAKEIGFKNALKVGDTVGFEDIAYRVEEILDDNQIVISIPNKEDSTHTVPITELYDPYVANEQSRIESAKSLGSHNN